MLRVTAYVRGIDLIQPGANGLRARLQCRAAMPRKAVFRLAQANSLGLKAGDEAGSKWRWQPAALMAARALAFLCMRRVSSTTVIPGRNVGISQVRSH